MVFSLIFVSIKPDEKNPKFSFNIVITSKVGRSAIYIRTFVSFKHFSFNLNILVGQIMLFTKFYITVERTIVYCRVSMFQVEFPDQFNHSPG